MQGNISGVWPFTGRDDYVDSFLEIIGAGKFNAYIIKGDVGVGKTRLADECLAKARAIGHRGGRSAVPTPDGFPLAALAHLLPGDFDSVNPVNYFRQARENILSLSGGRRGNRFVLLVDELHLVDPASALLISQLLDAGIVFLIATLPFNVSLGKVIAALEGADTSFRVEMHEFSLSATEELLDSTLGGLVTPSVSSELHRLSGGNVSYLRELTLGAVRNGAISIEHGVWTLRAPVRSTRRLREMFASSLEDLGNGPREILELIALCGSVGSRDFPVETVCELERSSLVTSERLGVRERLSLTHPLYREMLQTAIPDSRKRYLLSRHMARIRNHGARRSQDALDIALGELEVRGKADDATLLRGAEVARQECDYSSVARLITASVRDGEGYPSQLLLGEALHELGRGHEADRILESVEEYTESEEDLVRAVITRSRYLAWGVGDSAKALEVNDRGLSQVRGRDTQYELERNHADIMTTMGVHLPGIMQSSTVKDVGRDEILRPQQIWALTAHGDPNEALKVGRSHRERAVADSRREFKVPHSTDVMVPYIFAMMESARISEAYELGVQEWRRIHDLDLHCSQISLSLIMSRCAIVGGLPRTARRWAGQAADLATRSHADGPLYAALNLIAEASMMSGDLESAERALSRSKQMTPWGAFLHEGVIGHAWYAASRGDLTLAKDLLIKGANGARTVGNVASEGRILTELGRMGAADRVAERLAEISGSSEEKFSAYCAKYISARADGNPDDLFSSAHSLEHAGAFLLAAEAAASAASSWRRRHSTREATAAGNKAAALASLCEGAKTSDLATTPISIQLTRREREITLLIVERLTNAEIADRVKISRRTVENHLQNIYRKVGVASRNELRNMFASD